MKCNKKNDCAYNPKRHNTGQEIARSYTRQPVKDYEHGNCPHRIDGLCDSSAYQVARFKSLRSVVKSLRSYRKSISGYVQIEYNPAMIDDLFKMFKGHFIDIQNPVTKAREFFYKPLTDIGFKGGDISKFLNGIVDYQINKIKDWNIPISLLTGFDRVIIEKGEVRLFADLENFNDPSIYNYDREDDENNFWYQKEIRKGDWKVRVFIREPKPLAKEGELNTER